MSSVERLLALHAAGRIDDAVVWPAQAPTHATLHPASMKDKLKQAKKAAAALIEEVKKPTQAAPARAPKAKAAKQ